MKVDTKQQLKLMRKQFEKEVKLKLGHSVRRPLMKRLIKIFCKLADMEIYTLTSHLFITENSMV